MGGAKPTAPDAEPRPDHHLVVHVYDKRTGRAITNAKVHMSYQRLDAQGKLIKTSVKVPIVIMQMIGKGQQTTHYGNNVIMPEGMYAVTVVANGKKAHFRIAASAASSEKMNMQ